MNPRRENRIAALQFLFAWEINRPSDLRWSLRNFFEDRDHPRDHYAFAEELVGGAIGHIDEIDGIIRQYASNWDFSRIAKIDLAILRLAIFEMGWRRDIPPVVSINEAIELSKIFSIEDARRFINGILDKYKLTLTRPLRTAALD